jgi:lipopolysaccharide/colanic/teichoic acid biosynthesis glycosyltransferase
VSSPSPAQQTEDRNQRELLARYSGVGIRMGMGRARFHVKRLVFVLVVFGAQVFKRLLDVVISFVALIVLMPAFLLLAAAIRIESKGSVLFRQVRIGAHGKPFTMYKFRSMYLDAEERKKELAAQNEMAGGVLFKMKHDPRITRIGRIIRKTSIDELPQLWNVFRGNMSLVGPRPPIPSEVADYSLQDHRRLEITPGITCIWQVTGRSDIPFDQQVELDSLYIESQTFMGDLKLLAKTIPAVLLGRGAY